LGVRTDHFTYTRVAFECREILKDFTDSFFKEEFLQEGEVRPTRSQTKNKLRAVLKTRSGSETTSLLVSERFDYIMNYFDVLSDFINKESHPEENKTTYESARACLIFTYLFLWDILTLL
jgi:hypothetical protein